MKNFISKPQKDRQLLPKILYRSARTSYTLYTPFAPLLHPCYTSVTPLLEACYTRVTPPFHPVIPLLHTYTPVPAIFAEMVLLL